MKRLTPVAPMLAVILLVAACGSTDDENASSASQTAQGQTASAAATGNPADTPSQPAVQRIPLGEPITHVHGLMVDESGSLRAGTHEGVRVVTTDGKVDAVGPQDDLMGMTGEPQTMRMVSSGHPGRGSALPNPIGLIRSEDGGKTWETLSLAGEIDFHALATTGDFVVGFDGVTGLITSVDGGKTWDQAAALGPASLAVVGDEVWATTEEGLQHSTDRAKTFTKLDDAPLLWQVTAGADGALWGVDPDGLAWRSKDGITWEQHEKLPQIQAIAAVDYDTAYAINETELVALTG